MENTKNGLLEGKVAIITGGTSGIGAASVKKFVDEGAKVVIVGRRDAIGKKMEETYGDAVRYRHTDVTKEQEIVGLIEDTVSWFGKLDIYFGNAGTVGSMASVQDSTTEDFQEVVALDVYSTLWAHKYAARQFIAQGSGGSIITTSSLAGLQASWGAVSYTSAKHAVHGIVRQAAADLGAHGIRCNAIAAGVVITPMLSRTAGFPVERTDEVNKIIQDRLGPKQASGRFAVPEDIANVAVLFCAGSSRYELKAPSLLCC